MAFALLPQTAGAQDPPDDPDDACPEDAPESDFTDREDIPPVHRQNVDCAAHFDIVQGFADNTYRPRLQVRRDQMASFIALTLDAAGVALPAADEDAFTDVGEGNVHADNINRLAAAGIVEGGPLDLGPDEYGPALRTRRDQMASFLMRAAGFALEDDVNAFDSTTQQFTDVPSGNVHFAKVNAAAENNIAQGVGGGQYDPRDETRRDQMASFVVRLLNFILDDGGPPPPVGPGLDLALDPAECVVGEEITATATAIDEDEAGVQDVDVEFETSGLVADPVTGTGTTDAEGAATFAFTPTEAGDLTVTVTGTIDGEEFTDTVTVNCPEPQVPEGPITLDAASAEAGGGIAGAIEDPGTVQSVSVTGCGFQNENVTIGGDGRFSLTVPAGQAPGTCDLTFNILRTDGSTESQTIPFTVTAAATQTTDAPDLVSASANTTTGVVTYVFDSNIGGAAPVPNDFLIYNPSGTRFTATAANLSGGTNVIAQFTPAQAAAAVRATVREFAVFDAAGRFNYAADAPLGAPVQPAGVTSQPDLQSVSNCLISNELAPVGAIGCEFRFDQPIRNVTANFGDINPAQFEIILSDGTSLNGAVVSSVSADGRTVRVLFAVPVNVPISAIVRGAVESDAVFAASTVPAAGAGNVLQTEPRTGDPAFAPGAQADRTVGPDMVSASVAGTNVVQITFDQDVQAVFNFAAFRAYDASANEFVPATNVTRSPTDNSVVNVTFAPNVVANAVGISIDDGAVLASANNEPNQEHELPLQNIGFTAGRTALPDLVSVTVTVDAFGNNTVVYTFDSALPAGAESANNYRLVDAQGTIFVPAGNGERVSDTVVRFRFDDAASGEFTNAQAAAAVIGSVQDNTGPNAIPPASPPDMTEGDVPVIRS